MLTDGEACAILLSFENDCLCIRLEHFRGAGEADGPVASLGEAKVTGCAFFGIISLPS